MPEEPAISEVEQIQSARAMALFRFRAAYFKADITASEASERFSQLLLGFAAGALALLAGNLQELAGSPFIGYLKWSAVILGISLFLGAAQLTLAHVAALVRAGFVAQEDAAKAGEDAASVLPPEESLSILRQSLIELRSTRLPPDRWLIDLGLREASLLDGVCGVQRRIQRLVQWQAALFRLQLLTVATSAVPAIVAVLRTA